jgi:lipoprotein-anchoring transpeptidase ErfK/SrfK
MMSAVKLLGHACAAILGATFVASIGISASAQSFASDTLMHGDIAVHEASPQSVSLRTTSAEADITAPLQRQVVSYRGDQPPGTIIIDTAHTFLYLTLGGGEALRYGIGVGRKGFTWSGVETISRKSEWPDWIPPAEMIARQPYLPRWVGGGPGNPLGARALYLGNTNYRIHGTNNPGSIGKHVSSGCIRMRDADVVDLYSRVTVGTKVVVLPSDQGVVALNDRMNVAERGLRPKDVAVKDVVQKDVAQKNVAIDSNRGSMTARIAVTPVQQAEWSSNPTRFGLY